MTIKNRVVSQETVSDPSTLSHFNIINLISWTENDNTPRVIQRKEEEEESWLDNNTIHVNRKKRRQRGGKVDIQKKIEKLGIEFHPFSLSKRKRYQYLGPGTFLKKRLARGDPGINPLDRITKQHDIVRRPTQKTCLFFTF